MTAPYIGAGVQLALAQVGDKYIFGAEAAFTNPNPEAFDCSELTEWLDHRVGPGKMPDGSMNQLAYCQNAGTMLPIEKALGIRGALMFRHVSVTGVGHVAISLGKGLTAPRTVEARGSAYGVGIFDAAKASRLWTHAAYWPGFDYKKKKDPKLAEFWVCLGRYGGRWGRAKDLSGLHDSIEDAEAKHGIALVVHRNEPVDMELAKKAEFPRWLAEKHAA